jgi:predicted dienelactone hydrolase
MTHSNGIAIRHRKLCQLVLLALGAALNATAQTNRIDIVRHDAPELAQFGKYDIGVRTLELIDPHRPDILRSTANGKIVYYDRGLIVEVWYPATLVDGQAPGEVYSSTTRNPTVTASLMGRAVRDAAAVRSAGAMPLVIISHGYPGNRYLMSHVGENLASKGYVVASIDHRDSTYEDQQSIWSTLYNRPLDQLFVLEQMALLGADTGSFLHGIVDVERTGIVGYSMGGYGLIINLGGGYSDTVVNYEGAPPDHLADHFAAANPEFARHLDTRIKAGLAIAPWGMANGVWNSEDLHNITTPSLYLSGSLDTTAGYEDGTRAIFENSINSDRYLLTYINAGHNAIAPIPLPFEIQNNVDQTGASHYTDPVWDSVRSANVMNHFATAFFDYYLKGDTRRISYLELLPNAQDGIYDVKDAGPTSAHTYWKGFAAGTARGLMLEHRPAAD